MIRHEKVVWGAVRVRWETTGLQSVPSQAVEPLPITMVKPAFDTVLVSAVCRTPLLAAALLSASVAAISLTPVTVSADEEQSSATLSPTEPLSQYELGSV
jgi:hypothetical protein